MNMKTKSIIASIVAVSSLLAVSSILVNQKSVPVPTKLNKTQLNSDQTGFSSSNEVVASSGAETTPEATRELIVNHELAGFTTQRDFNIPVGYEYLKVAIQNTGSNPVTFTVNEETSSGPAVLSGTVDPDKKLHSFFTDSALASQTTYVITVSSGSSSMSGTLDVHSGSELAALKVEN